MHGLPEHTKLRLEAQILQACSDICGTAPDLGRVSECSDTLRELYRLAARVVGSYIHKANEAAPINRLPAELLCHVAAFLPRSELDNMTEACSSWHEILTSCPTLWNTVVWNCLDSEHRKIQGDVLRLDKALAKAKSPNLSLTMPNREGALDYFPTPTIWALSPYHRTLTVHAGRIRVFSVYSSRSGPLGYLLDHLPFFPQLQELTVTAGESLRGRHPDVNLFLRQRAPAWRTLPARRLTLRGFTMRPDHGSLPNLNFPHLEVLELQLKGSVSASCLATLIKSSPVLKRLIIRLLQDASFTEDAGLQSPRTLDYLLIAEQNKGGRQVLALLRRTRPRHLCFQWTAQSEEHPYYIFDTPNGTWTSLAMTLKNDGQFLDIDAVDSAGFTRTLRWATTNDRLGERTTRYSPWSCRQLWWNLVATNLTTIRVSHNYWPALAEGMLAQQLETLVVLLSPYDDELMLQGTTLLPKLRMVRFEIGPDEARMPVEIAVLVTFLRGLSCGAYGKSLVPRVELDRWIRIGDENVPLLRALAAEIVVET